MRVSGVVVAIDERETKHFYMIDDGSGATIECVVRVPPRSAASGNPAAAATANAKANGDAASTLPLIDAPVDVGHVLDIKGSVGTFRGNKQVRAEKIAHLRSTEQEVVFWEKVTQLKRDVLSEPWILDPREVRKCRREEEGQSTSRRHRSGETHTHKRRAEKRSGLERTKRTRVENTKATGPGKTGSAELERTTSTGLEGVMPMMPEKAGSGALASSELMGPERLKPTGLERSKRTGLERSRPTAPERSKPTGLERTKLTGLERKKSTGLERARSTGLENITSTRLEKTKSTGLERKTRTGLEKAAMPRAEETQFPQERQPLASRPVKVTGLEKRRATKPVTGLISVTGKYDTLGS